MGFFRFLLEIRGMNQETITVEAAGRTFTAVVKWLEPLSATVTVNVDGQDIEFRADDNADMVPVNPGNADPDLLAAIGKALLEY